MSCKHSCHPTAVEWFSFSSALTLCMFCICRRFPNNIEHIPEQNEYSLSLHMLPTPWNILAKHSNGTGLTYFDNDNNNVDHVHRHSSLNLQIRFSIDDTHTLSAWIVVYVVAASSIGSCDLWRRIVPTQWAIGKGLECGHWMVWIFERIYVLLCHSPHSREFRYGFKEIQMTMKIVSTWISTIISDKRDEQGERYGKNDENERRRVVRERSEPSWKLKITENLIESNYCVLIRKNSMRSNWTVSSICFEN